MSDQLTIFTPRNPGCKQVCGSCGCVTDRESIPCSPVEQMTGGKQDLGKQIYTQFSKAWEQY